VTYRQPDPERTREVELEAERRRTRELAEDSAIVARMKSPLHALRSGLPEAAMRRAALVTACAFALPLVFALLGIYVLKDSVEALSWLLGVSGVIPAVAGVVLAIRALKTSNARFVGVVTILAGVFAFVWTFGCWLALVLSQSWKWI